MMFRTIFDNEIFRISERLEIYKNCMVDIVEDEILPMEKKIKLLNENNEGYFKTLNNLLFIYTAIDVSIGDED